MAGTAVKIKQSAVAGKIPVAGDLLQGELALNTADQKLYSKDGGGTVFELTSSSTATFDMGNYNRDVILAGGTITGAFPATAIITSELLCTVPPTHAKDAVGVAVTVAVTLCLT